MRSAVTLLLKYSKTFYGIRIIICDCVFKYSMQKPNSKAVRMELRWYVYCIMLLQSFVMVIRAIDDFRHISYADLVDGSMFREEGVTTYSQLLFDVARQQVVVGARIPDYENSSQSTIGLI
ncbi:hypothetical protein M0802_006019 [Mischocyttarus mexicanus]|nr:hypothetical protein M0802_006019 [Mischocyttarus mexicanus]